MASSFISADIAVDWYTKWCSNISEIYVILHLDKS